MKNVKKAIEILTTSLAIKALLMNHPVDISETGASTIEDARISKHVQDLKDQLAELQPPLSRIQ